ncbi:expressed protein [Echinococcus multilocularis]|uniref:Expressed protein n=1 Tax=Echinococcus multilocularis TaxID=6211 RepID=A0A068Y632_ECHMU|nr:expressed protein [Echinococcus multilocularis]
MGRKWYLMPDYNVCSRSSCPWLKKRDCTVTFVVISPVILLFSCTTSKAPPLFSSLVFPPDTRLAPLNH